jgi:hypothetical protein
LVTGADPSNGTAIPSNLEGFEQIRRELTAHCAETPIRLKVSKLPWTADAIFALASLLAVFTHNLAVFLSLPHSLANKAQAAPKSGPPITNQSFSWEQAEKIAEDIRKMDGLGDSRKEQ